MRNAFLFVAMLTVGMTLGCGKAEVKVKADPDPRVSDPYRNSSLDADTSKPKQDKSK